MVWKMIFLGGLIVSLGFLLLETDTWTATIYNNVSLDVHEHVGVYPSLDECRAGARAALERLGWGAEGAYECGMNCEPWADPELDMVECEMILD